MTNRQKWIAAALGAAAAVGGTVAASATGAESPAAAVVAAPAPGGPVEAIQQQQWRRIGELRRARTAADDLPARWRKAIEGDAELVSRWGTNPALARRSAPSVWLVPGNGVVCVARPGRDGSLGVGCASAAEVELGLLQPSELDANGTGVVTGVLPDGVAAVTLVDRDGTSRTVAVERNTYQAAIDADLAAVRFTDATGRERSVPMTWTP